MRGFELAICAILAFLLPIAFYCLIIGFINRRHKPLLVSGVWDSVGLLFAVSGFFLVTVPMLMAEFYLRAFIEGESSVWVLWLQQWVVWIIYFLLLVSGCTLMLLWRAHKTMVYNVDPELFARALERTLDLVGLARTMRKDRLILTPAIRTEGAESTAITPAAPKQPAAVSDDARYAELEIDSFPSMCHVTLHWDNYGAEVRRQVEAELERSLDASAPLENPAAAWFLNISGMIFGALMMVIVTYIILIFISRR